MMEHSLHDLHEVCRMRRENYGERETLVIQSPEGYSAHHELSTHNTILVRHRTLTASTVAAAKRVAVYFLYSPFLLVQFHFENTNGFTKGWPYHMLRPLPRRQLHRLRRANISRGGLLRTERPPLYRCSASGSFPEPTSYSSIFLSLLSS